MIGSIWTKFEKKSMSGIFQDNNLNSLGGLRASARNFF